MERKLQMEELDLKEWLNIFWSRRFYIMVIIAIFIVIGFIYSFIFVSPVYKSETTLVLVKSNENNTTSETTTTDLTLNQRLVSTYSELIKTKKILGEVIDNLGIDRTEEQLKNSITVNTVKDTELIKISVVDANPEKAKIIANEIAEVFKVRVANEVFKINNAQVFEKAEVSNVPSNINHTKDLMIFTALGVAIAVIYVLVANMLDTTVKGKEDVEKKLGISVLTTIPICDFSDVSRNQKKVRK